MTDFDLDRLGDVWRQQPDPAEMERAAAHRRRGQPPRALGPGRRHRRGAGRVGVVLFLVLSNPQTNTLLVGAAAILVLLSAMSAASGCAGSELRSLDRHHRGDARPVDRAGRGDAEAHHRFTLIGIGPALALARCFSVDRRSRGRSCRCVPGDSWFRPCWVGAWLAIGRCGDRCSLFRRLPGPARTGAAEGHARAYRGRARNSAKP